MCSLSLPIAEKGESDAAAIHYGAFLLTRIAVMVPAAPSAAAEIAQPVLAVIADLCLHFGCAGFGFRVFQHDFANEKPFGEQLEEASVGEDISAPALIRRDLLYEFEVSLLPGIGPFQFGPVGDMDGAEQLLGVVHPALAAPAFARTELPAVGVAAHIEFREDGAQHIGIRPFRSGAGEPEVAHPAVCPGRVHDGGHVAFVPQPGAFACESEELFVAVIESVALHELELVVKWQPHRELHPDSCVESTES